MRSRQINVRLNDDEYQLIKEAADAEELTVSSYIRQVSLDAAAPEPADISHPSPLERLIAFLLSTRQGAIPAAINETAPARKPATKGKKEGAAEKWPPERRGRSSR